MARKPSDATGVPEHDDSLTPAQADAELIRREGQLSDDEIERLATIADLGDEEAAELAMPESEGFTRQNRDEWIAGERAGRRWLARSAMRPGETGDEWRERLIAQSVAERGCAPYVIPARRREDVLEIDLAKLRRRDRRRLFAHSGYKSLEDARRNARRVLRRAGAVAWLRPTAARPRERREARSAARRGRTRAGPRSDDPHLEPPPVLSGGRA